MKLSLEILEARDCPAPMATAVLSAGTLAIQGTNKADVVFPTAGANPGDVSLVLNNQTLSFSGVTNIVANLNNGNDNFQNNSGLPSVVFGGKGDDVIYNILSPTIIFAQDGKNELDRIFHGPNATTFLDAKDREVTFFAPGRTIGSGSVVLDSGVLYVTPGPGASNLVLISVGNNLLLTGNLGTAQGTQTWTFNKNSVHTVAYFGSPQNDSLIVNTDIDVIGYGGAGNDVLVSTSISNKVYVEWKGLGGNDNLVTLARNSLLNGGSGADLLFGRNQTILQAVDNQDQIFRLF